MHRDRIESSILALRCLLNPNLNMAQSMEGLFVRQSIGYMSWIKIVEDRLDSICYRRCGIKYHDAGILREDPFGISSISNCPSFDTFNIIARYHDDAMLFHDRSQRIIGIYSIRAFIPYFLSSYREIVHSYPIIELFLFHCFLLFCYFRYWNRIENPARIL